MGGSSTTTACVLANRADGAFAGVAAHGVLQQENLLFYLCAQRSDSLRRVGLRSAERLLPECGRGSLAVRRWMPGRHSLGSLHEGASISRRAASLLLPAFFMRHLWEDAEREQLLLACPTVLHPPVLPAGRCDQEE